MENTGTLLKKKKKKAVARVVEQGSRVNSTSQRGEGYILAWWSLPSLREAVGSSFLFC